MKNSLRLAIVLTAVACLLVGACAKESSEAREAEAAEAEDSKMASGDVSGESTPRSNAGSVEAYNEIKAEIQTAQRTSRDQQEFLETVQRLLTKFAKEYPGTEEAADAQLNLGSIYWQTGRTDEAIEVLYEIIDGGTASNEKVGYAHYVLGDAYKNSDQFDKAKREYDIVVNEFAFLPAQVLQMARTSRGELDSLKRLAVGSKPIPFEVKDTEGNVINLEKYKGKVVLLDFWATWCGPCRVDMPNVVSLYKKHHKNGFEIIGISLDRSRMALDRYVEANDMDWPQYFDGKYWQNDLVTMYSVKAIPATFLIDRQGVIRYRSLRGKQLDEAVSKLVKETS